MGEILGLGCTHWPILCQRDEKLANTFKKTLTSPLVPEAMKDPSHWPERLRGELGDDGGRAAAAAYSARLAANFRSMRKEIDAFNPDVVILWGDDQYENFREDIIPPFCVLAYGDQDLRPWDSDHGASNRWGETAEFSFRVNGAREIGKSLVSGLIDRGIDMPYAYKPLNQPGLSHAFINTLLFLDWDRVGFPYPVLPMAVNCYGRDVFKARGGLAKLFDGSGNDGAADPPGPNPDRCMDVGAAIADHFLDSDLKVALIASASWSHAFLSPVNHYLWSDMDADRHLFEALRNGDYDVWRRSSTDDLMRAGQHEMLNWMLLAGAMERLGRRPLVHDYIESYLFTSQKVFLSYPPEPSAEGRT